MGDRHAAEDRGQGRGDTGGEAQERQEVGPAAGGTGEAGHELAAVLDADAVEEHDEAEQAQERRRCGAGDEGPQCEPDEEDGPHAERQAAQADFAQGIAEADHEEEGEERLRGEKGRQGLHHRLRRPASGARRRPGSPEARRDRRR